ncbi:MAG: Hsp33 family molecular chaperone HslO, partial [Acetobacteraceae bacterium]
MAPRKPSRYSQPMTGMPAFLDRMRPAVPDLVVPRGILPFILSRHPVRGRLVRLGPLAEALIGRHRHHSVVAILAGQALALVAGLASSLRFSGSFSLQVKGDGPVSVLQADCTETGALRFYVRVDE